PSARGHAGAPSAAAALGWRAGAPSAAAALGWRAGRKDSPEPLRSANARSNRAGGGAPAHRKRPALADNGISERAALSPSRTAGEARAAGGRAPAALKMWPREKVNGACGHAGLQDSPEPVRSANAR